MRLRGKQTLAPTKGKRRAPVRLSGDTRRLSTELGTKNTSIVVLQRKIVKLVDETDMQSKSILVLQRANEKLQGESDMHRKSILQMHRTNEMQTKSILALHRANDGQAKCNLEMREASDQLSLFAHKVRRARTEPERDLALERLAKHIM